jgi:hypothetical protein
MGSTPGSFRRGVDDGESPEQAMYRELYEEIGLKQDDVTTLQSQLAEVSLTQTTRSLGQFTGLYWPEAEMVFVAARSGRESTGSSLAVMVTRNLMIGVGSASGTRFVRSSPSSGRFTAG